MDDGPLIDGELMPDERLTEVKLAESLQISRTPLRQALQRLETEGWIRQTSTGGILVGGVSELEIEALYDVRSTLESLGLGQAITRLCEPAFQDCTRTSLLRKEPLSAAIFWPPPIFPKRFTEKSGK